MFSMFDLLLCIFKTISSRAFLPFRDRSRPMLEPKLQALDDILEKYTSKVDNHLRGATFLAVNDKGVGETLYSKSFGSRQFDEMKDAPLQIDTVLWIASLTKLVTSIACMIAVEQGLVTLDENVREIVPELKDLDLLVGFEEGKNPRKPILEMAAAPISIRQLLSHQSGFAYDQLHPGLQEWSNYNGRTDWTMTGSYGGYTHPIIFDPGCGWVYGAGMDWAGRTVEVVSGLTLEEFMQKNIFSKLGMIDTTFRPEFRPGFSPRRMEMAWRDRSTGLLSRGKSPWAYPAQDCCGGVGLYSTADDYAKVLKALLAGGGPILKKSSADEIMASQLQNPKHFLDVINGPGRAQLGQTWPEGAQATFGLSSSINLEDFPGRRQKNSANWSGMPGLHAWVDRETGVAGLLTTQVLPPGDPMVTKCFLELETTLYKCLRAS